MINDKKVLFSGMQATGNLTLGNYLGALKNWVTLSDDMSAFTVWWICIPLRCARTRQPSERERERC